MTKSEILSIIETTCDKFGIPYPDKITYTSGINNGWCHWNSDGTKELEFPSSFIGESKYNRTLMKWVILHEVTHLKIIDQKHGSEFKKLEEKILDFNGIKAKFENKSDQYPSELQVRLKNGSYMFAWRKQEGEDVTGKEWDHLHETSIKYRDFFDV